MAGWARPTTSMVVRPSLRVKIGPLRSVRRQLDVSKTARTSRGSPYCSVHSANLTQGRLFGTSNRLPTMGYPGGPGGSGPFCFFDVAA